MSEVLERVERKLFTADEFMALPLDRVELVCGEVVHLMPPLFIHSLCASRVYDALSAWAKQTGKVFFNGSLLSVEPQS